MDSKVNFTLVGAFLFIFIFALIGFSFWLGKYGLESKKVDFYKVYLEESISGLNIESSIKYKGLLVGVVKDINIDPNNSQQLEILIEVTEGTPIKEDTVAVLEAQGVTGLKYIDLVGGSKDSAMLLSKKDEIAVIRSRQSFFGNLGNSAQDITKKVSNVLDKLDILLSKNNIEQISNVISNANILTKNLNNTVLNIDSDIKKATKQINLTLVKADKIISNDIQVTINNLEKFTEQLNATLLKTDSLIDKDIKITLEKVSIASDSTSKAFKGFGQLVKDGKLDLKEITSDSLKKFDILMIELERTIQNAQKSIDNLSDSPSDIIFKSRSNDFGPGEKYDD